jgi:hypothetical protein
VARLEETSTGKTLAAAEESSRQGKSGPGPDGSCFPKSMEDEAGMQRRRQKLTRRRKLGAQIQREERKGTLPRGVHAETTKNPSFLDPKCEPKKKNEDFTQDAKIKNFH